MSYYARGQSGAGKRPFGKSKRAATRFTGPSRQGRVAPIFSEGRDFAQVATNRADSSNTVTLTIALFFSESSARRFVSGPRFVAGAFTLIRP